jgi:hypothetical protein
MNNDEVIHSIKSRKIWENVPLEIEDLSLWGGEPTINLDYLIDDLDYIVNRFKNLKKIMFSTNLIDIAPVKRFIKKVELYNFKLDVQFSIDGPPELTKIGRKKHEQIHAGLQGLLDFVTEHTYKNLTMRYKVTWGPEHYTYLAKNVQMIYEYYSYMKNVTDILIKAGYRDNYVCLAPGPCYPGNYTDEQIQAFKIVIEHMKQLRKTVPYVVYPMEPLFINTILNLSDFSSYHYGAQCSAGRSAIATTVKEKTLCQYFLFPQQKFRKEYSFVEDSSRFLYLINGFHRYYAFRLALVNMLMIELLLANKISDVYNDPQRRSFMSLLLVMVTGACKAELINMGSINLVDLNLIQLFCYAEYDKYIAEVMNDFT